MRDYFGFLVLKETLMWECCSAGNFVSFKYEILCLPNLNIDLL